MMERGVRPEHLQVVVQDRDAVRQCVQDVFGLHEVVGATAEPRVARPDKNGPNRTVLNGLQGRDQVADADCLVVAESASEVGRIARTVHDDYSRSRRHCRLACR
jgi:hypothetical protein